MAAFVALAGCANLDYAMDEYGGVPMVEFEYRDHPYRIFDKPDANKLMITSSLGSALGGGLIRGLTLGIVNNHPAEPTMHQAVEAYLAKIERECQVQTGTLIAEPQWEFRYSCKAR